MRNIARTWLLIAGCVFLTGCSGWQSVAGGWHWPWQQPKVMQSKYGHPARMVVIWSPDILSVAGKPPTRGFGGRIYFYNSQNQTIPVEGQLMVFGYDDTDSDTASVEPTKRFAFTPEQFSQHFSATEIGASYSVWVPWDSGSMEHRTVSLLPVFTSVDGQRLVGQQSLNILGGLKPEALVRKEEWQRQRRQYQWVAPANYEQTGDAAPPLQPMSAQPPGAGRDTKTLTIPVPGNLSRRMAEVPQASAPSPTNADTVARNLEAFADYQRTTAGSPPGPLATGATTTAAQARRPAAPPADSPAARFGRRLSQAPVRAIERYAPGPGLTPPPPAEPPSPPPGSPPPGPRS